MHSYLATQRLVHDYYLNRTNALYILIIIVLFCEYTHFFHIRLMTGKKRSTWIFVNTCILVCLNDHLGIATLSHYVIAILLHSLKCEINSSTLILNCDWLTWFQPSTWTYTNEMLMPEAHLQLERIFYSDSYALWLNCCCCCGWRTHFYAYTRKLNAHIRAATKRSGKGVNKSIINIGNKQTATCYVCATKTVKQEKKRIIMHKHRSSCSDGQFSVYFPIVV